jgi:hypothetical protein
VDTVDRWEASHALKGAVEALLADTLRAMDETDRPAEVALIFGERLQRLMRESGLPFGVGVKEAFGGKTLDVFLGALEAGGLPPQALAEIRAGLGRSAERKSPSALDRAAALARVPAIALPEAFEEAAAALARVPAISLPEHLDDADDLPTEVEAAPRTPEGSVDMQDAGAALACVRPLSLPQHLDAGEPPAAAGAGAYTPEGPAHTEESTLAAGADAGASEGPTHLDGCEEATLRSVAKSAAAIGITLGDRELRMAARIVDYVRIRAAGMTTHRTARFAGPIRRRPRASRAPRRAAHRSAVAPARDGPPPTDDGPAPVASRSSLAAIGGSR